MIGIIMQGFIVCCVCCVLCALPLFIIGYFGKMSKEPIKFWAGEKNKKIAHIEEYNIQMSKLYIRCAGVLCVTPIFFLINIYIFIAFVCAECTIGIYLVYLKYKKILSMYQE